MTKFLVLLLVLVGLGLAQTDDQPGMTKEWFIRTALANVQQDGDFYFIPFPANKGLDFSVTRASNAQLTLTVLARFEKEKRVSITAFTVERNQNSYGLIDLSKIIGIFVKTVPRK